MTNPETTKDPPKVSAFFGCFFVASKNESAFQKNEPDFFRNFAGDTVYSVAAHFLVRKKLLPDLRAKK